MNIKTILVHLADDDHYQVRLEVAGELARRFKAHVIALFITTPIRMPAEVAGRGASAAYLAHGSQIARERAAALKSDYSAFCAEHGISFDWVMEEGDHLDLLAYHAHVADLAVISRLPHEHFEDRFRLRLPEELTMITGCPVLLLPDREEIGSFGRNVMVAWKSNREAVRAVRGAIGFLKEAETVTVLSVGECPQSHVSEREVVAYLKRHDVTAEPLCVEGDDVGEVLLAQAKALECDLMVMGAYGHSRFREIVFGGVTRHVFEHTTLPVLMAH